MKIKELLMDERPREKMLEKGANALSDADLLAILIRTGCGSKNAMDIARDVLKKAEGNLRNFNNMSIDDICSVKGVGPGKAVSILAALEIGKRFLREAYPLPKTSVSNSTTAWEIMLPELKGLTHEEGWILLLNRANYIICKERISQGGMHATVIDSRMIVKTALDKQASAVILFHNHPSGNPNPGNADIKQTRKLKKALAVFNIELLDHIIITDDCYYSFADNGAGDLL